MIPAPVAFTVRLELDTGETLEVPIDFDFNQLNADQLEWVNSKLPSFAGDDLSVHLAAACIFAQLDRPDDDWEIIGPALVDAIDPKGSLEHFEVT